MLNTKERKKLLNKQKCVGLFHHFLGGKKFKILSCLYLIWPSEILVVNLYYE